MFLLCEEILHLSLLKMTIHLNSLATPVAQIMMTFCNATEPGIKTISQNYKVDHLSDTFNKFYGTDQGAQYKTCL